MTITLQPISSKEEAELRSSKGFKAYLLKRFEYWSLYLNRNQYHLGRAYVWLSSRHVDLQPFSDLKPEELRELQMIQIMHQHALKLSFAAPDLVNCEWEGNEIEKHRGHGHMHLIPRYQEAPSFMGREYPDKNFGRRSDYDSLIPTADELKGIMEVIRAHLY